MRTVNDDSPHIKFYTRGLLEKMGKDFYTCELCGKKSKKKLGMHHTKYEGATIYDIKIACQSCNRKVENIHLI